MKKIVLLTLFAFFTSFSFAQTINQNAGWFLFLNSTKFNEKWGMHFDLQIRSENEWHGVRNLLVRPGITYYINKNANATVGYLFTQTFLPNDILIGAAPVKNTLNEHRVWQQFVFSHKLWKDATLSHRFRLEQRFIETQTDELFSQRLRYFFRLVEPLKKQENAFTKGIFVALQNEVFLNIQHKTQLNGSLFDQNRAYLAAGYRFSKKLDVEAGYLKQLVNGRANKTINNVGQLAIYTRF